MTRIYLVEMHLACDSLNERWLSEFDVRWPRSLERSWRRLSYPVSQSTTLEDELNARVLQDCYGHIETDTGRTPQYVRCFEPGAWRLGPDHRYCAQRLLVSVDPMGHEAPWEFTSGSAVATVSVHAAWRIVSH